ncbi:MAG: rRNA maturation RNase YbeY [Candidatus Omnitrophica bacterium]|nr:rRNA maturation RNase YbeY [Candidatus Omnitrophota bacterium]MBU1870469.1 rRNA maturation RNase YbeY [Candidatus Omnitrophota bacterium]
MKIIIRNLQKKIPISQKRIREVILKVLSRERRSKSGRINVCFVGDKQIKLLNSRYLHKNTPTDVIAFELSENKKEVLADIAISTDTVERNAKIYKTSPSRELELCVIHGVLHILGYDDNNPRNRLIMRKKEQYFLCPSIKPKP